MTSVHPRFTDFVKAATSVIEKHPSEKEIILRMRPLLAELVRYDDWLPEAFSRSHVTNYQQYLLYREPSDHFSIVSFVWAPGQTTPVHDHRVWGLVGVLRGAEISRGYKRDSQGRLKLSDLERLEQGQVGAVGPDTGDIHDVTNPLTDQASVSIHVYGGDIGHIKRHAYDLVTGNSKEFVSGYVNAEAMHSA